MNNAQLNPERDMILELTQLIQSEKLSQRLMQHHQRFGQGGLDRLIASTYWELGYGKLSDPGREKAIMTIGMNPSENHLHSEDGQPWGVMPLDERIRRWRMCDAWTLGSENRAEFERLNGGLDFGQPHTWAYFHRLRRLFRAAGHEERLRSSYNTNLSKFTSPDIQSIRLDFDVEADACLPLLAAQIRLVSPAMLVVIGVATLGESKNKPGIQKLFQRESGSLILKRTAYANGRRQLQSGIGVLPGVLHPMKVIVLPHTSGYAHVNFDPHFAELTHLVKAELDALYA